MITAKSTISQSKELASELRDWWIVDAEGQTVGRLCSQIAALIRGKHKPWFTPHVDCGDFVIVINAGKVKMSGKRSDKKEYFSHSGFPGRGKFTSFKKLMSSHPERVVEKAVKGMLPKNRLGRQMYRKLKVYAGAEHPHEAQLAKEFLLSN